jgi:hypothetical protein
MLAGSRANVAYLDKTLCLLSCGGHFVCRVEALALIRVILGIPMTLLTNFLSS